MSDALEGERQMSMPIPSYFGTRGANGWNSANGWTGTGSNDLIMFESYFDCSGYTRDGLTVFPVASTLQDPGRYNSNTDGAVLQVLDIISQVRLSLTDVYTWVTNNAMPGMLSTDVDYTQIIWGQYRTMLGQATFQANATEYLTANAGMFGSGAPSTAQKLYVYRFALLQGSQELNTLRIPASRMILSTIVGEEKELAFLMRQKRSYELAG